MHGFEDGLIVHDDIQLCQWLRTEDGSLKLGDFNRATIMDYKEKSGKYCKYKNGPGWGDVSLYTLLFLPTPESVSQLSLKRVCGCLLLLFVFFLVTVSCP